LGVSGCVVVHVCRAIFSSVCACCPCCVKCLQVFASVCGGIRVCWSVLECVGYVYERVRGRERVCGCACLQGDIRECVCMLCLLCEVFASVCGGVRVCWSVLGARISVRVGWCWVSGCVVVHDDNDVLVAMAQSSSHALHIYESDKSSKLD
jgi:hypothetical protein